MSSIPPPAPVPPASPTSAVRPVGRADDVPDWRMWMAPAAIVLGLAVGEMAVIFVDAIGAAAGSSFTHPTPAVNIIGNVVVDLSFVLAAIYLARLRGPVGPADFGFRRVSLRKGFAAFMLGGVSYYGLTAIYAQIFTLHGQDKLPSELGASNSDAALVAAAIFVCVIAPIAEEFFFRGFLFGALRRWQLRVAGHDIGPWIAAVIVGILFGLAHTGSASSQYLVPLGYLGFVLCIMRWKTRSLYPCIALHAFNNALALGVNELHWSTPGILGLVVASAAAVGALTLPLADREAPLTQKM
jgi:membrane protease YdiL (CAAX protease family)